MIAQRSELASLNDLLGRATEAAIARDAERDRRLEQHRRTCTVVPCVTCSRFPCAAPGCRCYVREPRALCTGCARADALERIGETIPSRFRWAFEGSNGTRELLGGRVELTEPLLDRALAWASASIDPTQHSARLVGLPQRGKTSLAVAMMRAFASGSSMRSNVVVRGARFARAIDLGKVNARHGRSRTRTEPPELTAALNAPLLVLDDLGAEYDAHVETMHDVIRHRFDAGLPTWITTGLSLDELAARYADGGFIARIARYFLEIPIGPRVSPTDTETST